jgi:hypothetical protein
MKCKDYINNVYKEDKSKIESSHFYISMILKKILLFTIVSIVITGIYLLENIEYTYSSTRTITFQAEEGSNIYPETCVKNILH